MRFVPNGSLVYEFRSVQETSIDEINAIMKICALGELVEQIKYLDE
jgi:hypothetical protein